MLKKITYQAAVLLLILPSVAMANIHHGANDAFELLVYKSPSCGCCKKWITHLESQGFQLRTKDFHNLSNIKNEYGISPNLRSCHTAVTESGFVFEGHVPSKFIKRFLLEEHPKAIGLSVPAMPVGSPGMEVAEQFMPYTVFIIYQDGSYEPYAKVESYDSQFD